MDDAISHMNRRADFVAAFRIAYDHLNPGSVMVVTLVLMHKARDDRGGEASIRCLRCPLS